MPGGFRALAIYRGLLMDMLIVAPSTTMQMMIREELKNMAAEETL